MRISSLISTDAWSMEPSFDINSPAEFRSISLQIELKSINEFNGKNFSELKQRLTEVGVEKFFPIYAF